MWNCEALRDSRHIALGHTLPRDRAEEKLLLRIIDPEPPPAFHCDRAPPEATDFAVEMLAVATRVWHDGQRLYVATDGGADKGTASWAAVASDITISTTTTTRTPLHGEDATPFAAELEALRQAYHAVLYTVIAYDATTTTAGAKTVRRLACLVDCLSTIKFAERTCVPPDRFAQWHQIRTCRNMLFDLRVDVELIWTPSHGKHPEWTPPTHTPGNACRDLNEIADVNATGALKLAFSVRGILDWEAKATSARRWSEKAITFAAALVGILEAHVALQLTNRERATLQYRLNRGAENATPIFGYVENRDVVAPASTGPPKDDGPGNCFATPSVKEHCVADAGGLDATSHPDNIH